MIVDILTLFPEMFDAFAHTSIVGRATAAGKVLLRCHNIRDHAPGKHRVTDDTPFGGGSGMVMKPEPLVRAIRHLQDEGPPAPVILLSPQGTPFDQAMAKRFAGMPRILLVCGRYEGVDERVRDLAVDEEVSIGNYVLTGGEPAAMVIVDATARLVPGVLGDENSLIEETFSQGLLEYPQYTRPRDFLNARVPAVLLSGDHARIAAWRRKKSLERTLARRPELLDRAELTPSDREVLLALSGNDGVET